jgi:hypothetical protein
MTNVSKLIFGAAIAMFAAVVCFEKPAAAQNHSWCAEYDFGSAGATNCGFATFQHCLAGVNGVPATLKAGAPQAKLDSRSNIDPLTTSMG